MMRLGRISYIAGLAIILTSCTALKVDSMIEEDKAAIQSPSDNAEQPPEPNMPADIDDADPSVKDFHMSERERREALRDLDYTRPVRDQTIDSLKSQLEIDEAYKKAKSIKPVQIKRKSNQALYDEQKIMTDKEMICSLLSKDILDKKIDLDFDEIKLSDIMVIIGSAGGINIVLDPQYKSLSADLHLKQVTVQEALTLITNSYDLGLKIVENSLFITSREKVKEENMISKVIHLKNISAAEAKAMIGDLASNVTIGEEINSLIVRGLPDQMVKVDRLIDTIDIPQPQVLLEAKIIEVNKDALKDLGIDWSNPTSITGKETGRGTIDDATAPQRAIYKIGRFERGPLLFTQIINILENQDKAKLLANPRISTLNGKEAEIFVGDKVPYSVTTVTGGVATTETRFVEPGIRLKVTPSIIDDDFVVMEIEPEVSFIFAFRGANSDVPQVKSRQAKAYVRVKNNETVVIGGLINQEDKDNLTKVPFVGDLPLIGNIFSHQKRTILDTELLITVTPAVVRD